MIVLYKATQVDLSARGSYCLVVSQAKHCGEFRMPKCRCPRAKVTFMELVVYTVFLPIFRRPEVGGKTRRNHRSFYETLSGVFDITPQMNNNS